MFFRADLCVVTHVPKPGKSGSCLPGTLAWQCFWTKLHISLYICCQRVSFTRHTMPMLSSWAMRSGVRKVRLMLVLVLVLLVLVLLVLVLLVLVLVLVLVLLVLVLVLLRADIALHHIR